MSINKRNWMIQTKRAAYRRWTWSIPYPISKAAIVGLKEYATEGAAKQAAYRAIRRLFDRGDMV